MPDRISSIDDTPSQSAATSPHQLKWLGAMTIVLATFAAYIPCMDGSLVWDDTAWTDGLTHLTQSAEGLWRIWSEPTAMQQYYPMTGTSFWLDRHLWDLWTFPCHVENVLIHALSAVFFWRLLRRLEVPGAWLAGAVFALHPVMVESVAWITQRKNVLSMVFFLATLLAWGGWEGWWRNDGQPRRRLAYALALALSACALFSKATTFVLPVTLLLLCWWKRGPIRWRRDVVPVVPFFLLAVAVGAGVWWLEKHHVGAQGTEFASPPIARILNAGRSWWFYMGTLLWPANLCFIYPDWRTEPMGWVQWLAPAAVVAVLSGIWFARNRIGRGAVVALFFFSAAAFPVLGFMDTYAARYAPVWDHWVYLPSLGIIPLMTALVVKAAERMRSRKVLPIVATALLAILGGLTWRQCGMYRNMESLWRTTLVKNPACWLAHNNLGTLLMEQGILDEALVHFQTSVELRPSYAEAWNNLGGALVQKGEPVKALNVLDRALELEPRLVDAWINSGIALLRSQSHPEAVKRFQKALEIQPDAARAESSLGLALLQSGKMQEALQHGEKAVELAPELAEARNNLGGTLLAAGRLDEARRQHEAAVRLQPDFAEAHYNLGNVLLQQGRTAEAHKQFTEVVRLQPAYADAHYNLGFLCFRDGLMDEALTHYREAVKLRPNHAPSRSSLALALLHSGHTREALAEYDEALKLDDHLLSALNNLAWLLATAPDAAARNGTRALELATRANELTGGNTPGVLKTLAAALAESGRHAEALEVARRAEALARQQGTVELAEVLGQCIRLFGSGQACRDETIKPLARPAGNR